jgi:hypothetical protein
LDLSEVLEILEVYVRGRKVDGLSVERGRGNPDTVGKGYIYDELEVILPVTEVLQ